MVTLEYTQEFTRGLLVGLVNTNTIRFVDRDHAMRWLYTVSGNIASGKLNYIVLDFRFV